MTHAQAKSELMQIYMSLSEEKKQALDVLMEQADGEYISKNALRNEIGFLQKYNVKTHETTMDAVLYDDVVMCIKDMPSVDIPLEHDGCKDCKYETYPEYYYPCCECKQNYKDMWEMKEPTDTITMTREEFSEKLMEHYRQGRADEKAYQNGEIMQSFNPD